MTFSQWIEDFRWAMNAMRARRWRRECGFGSRLRFDEELRPKVEGGRIAYPDALYHITINDLCRAIVESAKQKARPND